MTIEQLIKRVGGNAAFAREFGTPLRTVENWNSKTANKRQPPQWMVDCLSDLYELRHNS